MALSEAKSQHEYPMRIGMVGVLVEDPSAALEHYTTVLGFEEVMHMPEAMVAVVKSPLDPDGVQLLLEPVGEGYFLEHKQKLYEMGMPVMTLMAPDIQKTFEELKAKGVVFKKEPTKTDWGTEAIFDDGLGNYLHLFQQE